MDGDANYFSRRANEERIAAMKAADPRARKAHLILAQSYDERLKAAARAPHQLPVIEKAS